MGLSAALFVGGCTNLGALQSEPPHYNRVQHALIAEGYPIERIDMPRGFEFADIYMADRTQEHDAPSDYGQARISEAGVSWLNRENNTAIATAFHQGTAQGSFWLPWDESDGFEFVGGLRFQYGMYRGNYTEVTGDGASVPGTAPDCAVATHLMSHSADRRRRTTLTYAEGTPCNELSKFSQSDERALRERAYRLFGLK